MRSRADTEASLWTRIPDRVKLMMLVETLLMAFLAFWMSEEWTANTYLQTYARNSFQADGAVILTISSSGAAIGLVAVVLWMRRKSLPRVGTVEAPSVGSTSPVTPVEPAAEPLHPVVAAVKAAIYGVGVVSRVLRPPPSEEPVEAVDQEARREIVETSPPVEPGSGPVPVGIAIALLRTLLPKANPPSQKVDGERAGESVGSEKSDGKETVSGNG